MDIKSSFNNQKPHRTRSFHVQGSDRWLSGMHFDRTLTAVALAVGTLEKCYLNKKCDTQLDFLKYRIMQIRKASDRRRVLIGRDDE